MNLVVMLAASCLSMHLVDSLELILLFFEYFERIRKD